MTGKNDVIEHADQVTATGCRLCGKPLSEVFVDLGVAPLSNSYLRREQLAKPETFYPLCVYTCGACKLVQLPEFASPEHIFSSDYAYFSSYSSSWLEHAERFAATAVERFGLDSTSSVVEVASNDGYLLQFFLARGTQVLGIEPARGVAEVAQGRGIRTIQRFLGQALAKELRSSGHTADLLVGNNVLAHVPNLVDFVTGLQILLKPRGVISVEFPYLLELIEHNQFDTIYHEHFSYFSLGVVCRAFETVGLEVFDVERLPTHGGSLRVYAQHADTGPRARSGAVTEMLENENKLGTLAYEHFGARVNKVKYELLSFLLEKKQAGKRVVGYGAPAKGNTLLNYCGIRQDLLAYTVDRNPHKQGLYLPGIRIPILAPEVLMADAPDSVLILPWNLRDEVALQLRELAARGTQLVVVIPQLEILK